MNRERRKAVAKVLRSYREKKGQTQAEVAKSLGWEEHDYIKAERGLLSLSAGQQDDVRAMLKRAADSARVRATLMQPGKVRILRP